MICLLFVFLAKSTSGFLVKWEIPWDGKTVIVTITAFGLSFLFTGLAVSVLLAQLGFRHRQLLDVDERSLVIFINQILQTFVGTFVIKICTKSYIPLPRDLFYYDFRDPFSFSRGWLLWSVIGTFCGAAAVLLSGTLAAYINGEPLPRERRDALLQLLPLIGASSTSTALLLAVTGVLAPFLEETLFRGFLMTSLTKWMPTYAAVILSAGAFALAHLTPGQAPQLFALGVVLGFSYSKSGNLLTPIVIHGLWNSGVLLLLTVLRYMAVSCSGSRSSDTVREANMLAASNSCRCVMLFKRLQLVAEMLLLRTRSYWSSCHPEGSDGCQI
ncbi:hypothetical protein GOP47_0016207 [Adiantum capillus-veneris]|uniref:CAAX prenyl protease 2/Lysostaphin resistance protein A-like domain-containing protein n=1 Tax=Adiantum capillus-veneris TaxID=13818 RepID=A0A9D4UHN1_ADICA|nr:hypothetical protein GOP47_0016207 [Adiantum capillus-veneris]